MAKIFSIVLVLLLVATGQCCAATAEQFTDPMRPAHYQAPAIQKPVVANKIETDTRNWKLTAVLISAGRSVAVINRKALQVGEQIDSYMLIKITSDRAVLKNDQTTLVLHRAGTGLKKMSTKRDIRKGSKP